MQGGIGYPIGTTGKEWSVCGYVLIGDGLSEVVHRSIPHAKTRTFYYFLTSLSSLIIARSGFFARVPAASGTQHL
jgi:hypothetical protein